MLSIKKILTKILNKLSSLDATLTTATGNISTIQGNVSTIQGDISTINGQISTINDTFDDYLPLAGGTITGDVAFDNCEPTITKADSNGYYKVIREDTNTSVSFGVGTSGAGGIYSGSTSAWIINKDTSGVVNVNAGVTSTTKVAGTLTVEGHNSPIGSIIEVENDTTTSIPSGTSTPLMSITLPSGVWVVRVVIRIPAMGSDRTKYVYANISGTSGASAYMYRAPCENMITEVMLTQIITAGGTYYVNVFQNSGSAKTFVAGSAAYQNVRAVRIA